MCFLDYSTSNKEVKKVSSEEGLYSSLFTFYYFTGEKPTIKDAQDEMFWNLYLVLELGPELVSLAFDSNNLYK